MHSRQLSLKLGPLAKATPDSAKPEFIAKQLSEHSTGETRLMESICERDNMNNAWKRVVHNAGAPGVDGMKTGHLLGYLRRGGQAVQEALLNGTYQPLPVRRKEIPKPDGVGVRLLGIPTVLDRFVQQCMVQVLMALWDYTFSDSSWGYRPGRSQAQAIEQLKEHVEAGYTYAVSIDLSKFFDRVNHDRLMSRLATRVQDKRVLKLIRAFLNSGTQINDLIEYPGEGTPQGGPLSPLLSNIVLDELDQELERRGHRFVRYADDLIILVRSRAAGERVKASVSRYITGQLKLKVNAEKSGVARPWETKFLGFRVCRLCGKTHTVIHDQPLEKFKDKIRTITRRSRGVSLHQLIEELNRFTGGWQAYFQRGISRKLAHELNQWIVRRLKMFQWKQWKLPRTKVRQLKQLGLSHADAVRMGNTRKGAWRISKNPLLNFALPMQLFVEKRGLVPLG